MRNIFTLLLLATTTLLQAQCEDGRYRNFLFANASVTSGVTYGSNFNFDGTEQELQLDIYEPSGDVATDRPLVIVCHGGSFVAGSRDGVDVVDLCNELAQMGYVVASISYRLGIPISFDLEPELTRAVWRATHDAKAAVRFFRENAQGANTYRIDDEEIYMLGYSAGGFISTHLAYLTDTEEIPESIDQSVLGMGGGLEGESGNSGFSSEVKGIVSIAGAVKNADWLTGAVTPILSFHGTEDETVPYGTGNVQVFGIPVAEVDGSSVIHASADDAGIVNCFKTFEGIGHSAHMTSDAYRDTTLSISSNFLSHLHCDVELDCNYREIENLVGITEQLALLQLNVYPNPTQGLVTVDGLENLENPTARLLDYLGREVKVFRLSDGFGQQQLDISDLPSQLYLLEIRTESGLISKAIRKE